jgi:hypothetical protein
VELPLIIVNKIVHPASVSSHGSSDPLESGPGLPLSSPQLGIWFAQKINPSSPAYNIGEYIEIDGAIDPKLFEQALRQVVSETEALRLQIAEHAG